MEGKPRPGQKIPSQQILLEKEGKNCMQEKQQEPKKNIGSKEDLEGLDVNFRENN